MVTKVALLTAGGFAPCLSSAIGGLIERYSAVAPDVEIIAYRYGYQGLLAGDSLEVTPAVRANAGLLHDFGGSPIGNSRVKLTNAADLVKRGLVDEGVDPLQAAADRLTADGVDVLHTIGGRRHQHHRGRPGGLSGRPRLRPHRGGAAQDHRQRRHPDQAVAGRLDGGRAGIAVRPEHRRRAQLRLPDADRARGDGPALRLADRRDRRRVPVLAGHPRVAARDRPGASRAGTCTGSTYRRPSSTSTPNRIG